MFLNRFTIEKVLYEQKYNEAYLVLKLMSYL